MKMHRTCHLLVLVGLVLFSANTTAYSALRVANIQTMAGEEFLPTISAAELTGIDVNIINTGTDPCLSGSATLLVLDAETNQVVVNELVEVFGLLGEGNTVRARFLRTELGGLVNSPPANYRAMAQALCVGTPEHSRSFIFSLVEKQEINVPETNAFVVGMLLLVLVWLVFGRSTEKRAQNQ